MAVIMTSKGAARAVKAATSLHHQIRSDVFQVDPVCRDARNLLAGQGQGDNAFAVDLLLREFLNNAIVHGNQGDPDKKVDVTVKVGRDWIVVTIRDEGPGFDWRAQRRAPPDEEATSGRGLAIGEQFAQRLQFNREGNQVMLWINKDAKGAKPEDMGFAIERDDAQVLVTIGEKLTSAEVPTLQPALKEELAGGATEIIIDMATTVALDSTGIGLLIAASNSMAGKDGQVRVINVSADIMKLLSSMRLVDRLHAEAAER